MIFEGSCVAEDWNNDPENSALHHRNKLHSNRKQPLYIVIIFNKIKIFTVFLIKQIFATVSTRILF